MRVALALAALVLLTPLSGCCSFLSYSGFVGDAAPVRHSATLEALTVVAGAKDSREIHLLVRLDDGRRLHYSEPRDGRFVEVPGPLPASTVPFVVVSDWQGPWLDRERRVIDSGDPVHRPAAEGALAAATPLTERDLAEAEIVVVGGSRGLFVHPGGGFEIGRIAPDPARGRVWGPFPLGDDVVSVEAAAVERRNGAMVCALLARTSSGERVRIECVGGGPLTRTPTQDDLPDPLRPIVVVERLEDATPGGPVRRVAASSAIERRTGTFTFKDAQAAAAFELRRAGEAGPWRVRFRLPAGAFLDERRDCGSVWPPHEVSGRQVAGGLAFGLLLPVTAAVDLATLPFQVIWLAIFPPFI